jgi:hypothetical protein
MRAWRVSPRSYSYAKRMLEVQSRLYRAAHGLDAVCVIPVRMVWV